MTEQMTSVDQLPSHRGTIQEKPEDTPRSVDVPKSEHSATAGAYNKALLAVATATQIFGSSHAGLPDYLLNSNDMTCLSDQEPFTQRGFFVVPHHASLELSPESDAEAANRTRLELLARLYVSKKLSAEEDARLAIVTEKVRRLIPRVTVEDFESLGAIARESETIRLKNEERRRRMGI